MPTRQAQSGAKLDAFRLAREHGVVEGSVDAHRLSRVADVLAHGPADVAWRIEGSADAAGRPALAIEIAGSVPLTCQRCLDDFAWPVAQRTEVRSRTTRASLQRSTPTAARKWFWQARRLRR